MIEIIPAVMPKNFEDLKEKVSQVRGSAKTVQVDFCDGEFVKNKTWPYFDRDSQSLANILEEKEGMPFWEEVDYEFDIMVSNSHKNFDNFLRLGPKRVVFHLEAEGERDSFLEFIESIDVYVRDVVQIGIAINTTTPVEEIFPFINHIDFVQCMGIEHIGRQGEPHDEKVISHIKTIHEKYPDVAISVDGAVNFDTAGALLDAGATRLVVGSAIFDSINIRETIWEFQNLDN